MFFVMKAKGEPKNEERWFSGFEDGKAFKADDFVTARVVLDSLCVEAGTISDPHWMDKGPYPIPMAS